MSPGSTSVAASGLPMFLFGAVFSARDRSAVRPSSNTGGLLVRRGTASLARIVMTPTPREMAPCRARTTMLSSPSSSASSTMLMVAATELEPAGRVSA